MLQKLAAISLVLALGPNLGAYAYCSIDAFGKHQVPPKILVPPAPIDDVYAHFSYGSDASLSEGEWYAWNFIKNEDNRGLTVDWEKAKINQSLAAIAPGKAACRFIPLAEESKGPNLDEYIDRNSTIVYSSANQQQPASVYVNQVGTDDGGGSDSTGQRKPTSNDDLTHWIHSLFSTTYLDTKGDSHDVEVSVASAYATDRLAIQVVIWPPNLIVGLSDMRSLLGSENLEKASDAFKKEGYKVDLASAIKFVGSGALKLVGEDRVGQEYLFLQGQKAFVVLPRSPSVRLIRENSQLIVLDADHHPIASSAFVLYGLQPSP